MKRNSPALRRGTYPAYGASAPLTQDASQSASRGSEKGCPPELPREVGAFYALRVVMLTWCSLALVCWCCVVVADLIARWGE